MSFLDTEPDLKDTIYSAKDHQYAREYLRSAIERHDPLWLKEPIGPLRPYWLGTNTHSICYLIELARILYTLQPNVTKKSQSSFVEKFCALVRCKSAKQYEELLTEFQAAHILSERVSPVAFEPLVPQELLGTSNQPKSPDLAFRLPETPVFVEVTVMRFGALDKWDRRVNDLSEYLSRVVLKKKLRRAIALDFPLAAGGSALSNTQRDRLVWELLHNESGEWTTDTFGQKATVKWTPFPHISSDAVSPMGDLSSISKLQETLGLKPGELSATTGPQMMPAVGTWRRLAYDDSVYNLLIKSVRNTLDKKRIQFPDTAPYILVLKPGHYRLIDSGMNRVLSERIWPNADYSWILGLCIFLARTAFRKTDLGPSIFLTLNPNSRVQVPTSLLDLFNGRRQFHNS